MQTLCREHEQQHRPRRAVPDPRRDHRGALPARCLRARRHNEDAGQFQGPGFQPRRDAGARAANRRQPPRQRQRARAARSGAAARAAYSKSPPAGVT